MQDRPSRDELLRGVYEFLEHNVVPELSEPLRFHTRVAANLLRIIERELALEPGFLLRERERLARLLEEDAPMGDTAADVKRLNEELARRICRGDADASPWRQEVVDHLKETLRDKLKIGNPSMIEKAQRVD
jgi:hypothetical protein